MGRGRIKCAISSVVNDHHYRSVLFAILSLVVSFLYAIFNGVMGILSSSVWCGALAGYYILITLMRGGVMLSHRLTSRASADNAERTTINNLRVHRACGIFLIATIIALAAAIMQMVVANSTFRYAGMMIYVGAVYTTTKVTLAIINSVKACKRDALPLQTMRYINLADSAVSVLALQTAMFQSFGAGTDVAQFNAITGAVVCSIILAIGSIMIVRASNKLRQYSNISK